MQNWRYPAHGSAGRRRSNEPTSMNTGRVPRHCTLYGDASLSARSSRSARRQRSSCSSAASLSIENGHS